MFLPLLTLFTALSISAVAIYYSVAGLMAIFAAAAIPIMIMGGTLEIAKLVTAVWLHKYWNRATWWLKSYLSISVLVLMFITSMGIFGFLSRAHIEQTSAGEESLAKVETITSEIARQTAIIERAETRVKQLESSGTGADANVQAQIDKEQQRIDSAYARIQPAIDEQNKIIGSQAKLFQNELDNIDTALAQLQSYIDAGGRDNIKKAQAMVGATADGGFGPNTAAKFKAWQTDQQSKRQALLTKIQQATNNPQARAAATEIKRLRQTAERQVADSDALINRLRTNIGKTDNTAQIQADIDAQQERIKLANTEIDTLSEERIALEAQYRKLEAEVGPIKYIAEFIYGESADKNMLEEAVRWVIVIIIFVFDPLAVLLLLASQMSWQWFKEEKQVHPSAPAYVDAPRDFDEPDEKFKQDPTPPGWMFAKETTRPTYEQDDGPLTEDQIRQIQQTTEQSAHRPDTHPYLHRGFGNNVMDLKPMVFNPAEESTPEIPTDETIPIKEPTPESKIEVVDEDTVYVGEMEVKKLAGNYYNVGGKRLAAQVFDAEYPELSKIFKQQQFKLQADNAGTPARSSFGTQFPAQAAKGEMFLRVDATPNRLYKFNGSKWIEVDKTRTDSYTYNEQYIQFLVDKLASGEYELDQLSASEHELVAEHLERQNGKT